MRIGFGLATLAALGACGSGQQENAGAAPAGSEVTVVLPPPPPPADDQPDRPAAAPPAAAPRQGPVNSQQAAWAGVLRRVGFPCERVTSVRETGAAYRVDCAGGGPYRATRRDGRIKFSKWRQA